MKETNNQSIIEYDIKLVGGCSNLVKLIKKSKNLNILNKSNNSIIIEKNNNKIKLNLINVNKKDYNSMKGCIVLEYDINDKKSFDEIKHLWEEHLKKEDNIYLIGIKKNSEEVKSKLEATNFCQDNSIKFFIISEKDENSASKFINNLLETLGISNIEIKNNLIKKPKKNEYKVCFLGREGVGAKTSLINAIMGNKFNPNSESTLNASFETKRIKLNNENIYLNLWDTNGHEVYRPLSKVFIKDSDSIVLGFDITNEDSFQDIRIWYNIAKENSNTKLIYLIGNKIDLLMERKVTEEEARNLAKELNLKYFETSCSTNEGIYNFVYDLANEIIKY